MSESLKKTIQSNLGELDNTEMMLWLNKTIESEIIPRLLMGHKLVSANGLNGDETEIEVKQSEIVDFCQTLIDGPVEDCFSFIERMKKSGHSLISLYVNLIPASTRRLQELWENDENSFTEVTLALGRAQNLIHQLSPIFVNQSNFNEFQGNALLVNVPGSQHTLGILMLGEFFKLAGWNAMVEIEISSEELKDRIRLQACDLVAISVSTEAQWDTMESLLKEIKIVSKNKEILTMVGGPLFDFKPELVSACSADVCALTAEEAIKRVSDLLSQRNRLN
ncbi:cobalamin B12-binding domain-containing protein [Polynucleobacter sp. AP-Elch-400A-B2]|nr:cobalamin B12-binding domain-containing protein [Polynucleobacter sp. AP-Elch-400A-B2]